MIDDGYWEEEMTRPKRFTRERTAKALANLITELQLLGFSIDCKLEPNNEGHLQWFKRSKDG